ncbi:MAG: phenylalanine--tRNA ligase subunit alpha, partial [Candidatus Competibacter sp.]
MEPLPELLLSAQTAIDRAGDLAALDQVRVLYLGKKGALTERLKELGRLPAEQRREAGQAINEAKQALETALAARKAALETAALDARLAGEAVDVTLPGR